MSVAAEIQLKPGSTITPWESPKPWSWLSTLTQPQSLPAPTREDRLAWIAYPKAGKLGTDLNRDILAGLAQERGIRPVRQIAINETWSALRFRPAV